MLDKRIKEMPESRTNLGLCRRLAFELLLLIGHHSHRGVVKVKAVAGTPGQEAFNDPSVSALDVRVC